jgi:hypothetical protein
MRQGAATPSAFGMLDARPPTGAAFGAWQERLAASRAHRLERHAATLQETADAELNPLGAQLAGLVSLPGDRRDRLLLTPDFGSWLFSFRRWREAGTLDPWESPADLIAALDDVTATDRADAGPSAEDPEIGDSGIRLGDRERRVHRTLLRRVERTFGEGAAPPPAPERLTAFRDEIEEAMAILAGETPWLHEVVTCHTRTVLPVGGQAMISYSEQATPNVALLSTAEGGVVWYLELLAHESAHNWLASLMELTPLLAPDDRVFPSPWRQDARPLVGVLLAAQAFAVVSLGLLELLGRGLVDDDALRRRLAFEADRLRRGAALLAAEARFTPPGAIVHQTLADLVTEVDDRVREAAPGPAPESLDAIWPTAT